MTQLNSFIFDPSRINDYKEYLKKNGIIQFKNFIASDELNEYEEEFENIFRTVANEQTKFINGMNVVYNKHGDKAQRIPFVNQFSQKFSTLIEQKIYPQIKGLGLDNHRIGLKENNGMVATKFTSDKGDWTQMGWHTDMNSLYHIFHKNSYYNLGLHFDQTSEDTGCLKILPETHQQNPISLLTKKLAFADVKPDKNELNIETSPGDITIHDGRLWHRVSQNSRTRRVIYVSLLTGKAKEKNETSRNPMHMKIFISMRKLLKI